jgi:hypothetical protein
MNHTTLLNFQKNGGLPGFIGFTNQLFFAIINITYSTPEDGAGIE